MTSNLVECLTLISIVLGIISSIAIIGNNFKANSFLKCLFAIALSFTSVVFLKIIFEFFYSNWIKLYLHVGIFCIVITVLSTCRILMGFVCDITEDKEKDDLKSSLCSPLSLLIVAPVITLIINLFSNKYPIYIDFYKYLVGNKITSQTFSYMIQNIDSTLFMIFKIAEFIIISILALKALKLFIFGEKNEYKKDKFSFNSVLTLLFIWFVFSSNMFVGILETVLQWF